MVTEEVQKLITLDVPPQLWSEVLKGGDHAAFRRTTAGKIENVGPSQPYKHPVTGEIKNQHYKYANVTGTPFDMYLNIIPGMHPFHWDILSAIITPSSFFLGMIDGIADEAYAQHKVNNIYSEIIGNGKILADIANTTKWEPPQRGQPSQPSRPEREPTKYFERVIDIEDAIGITLELKDGKGNIKYKELYKSLD